MSLLGIDFFPISSFKPLSSKKSYPYYCVVGEYLLVLDWVNTSWIPGWPVYTPTDWNTGKFLSRDWYWNPRLSPSLSLSPAAAQGHQRAIRAHVRRHSRKAFRLNWIMGGTAMPWQRSALSECCEFVIKHRRTVWNMVFVSQNNSNRTGIIQTSPTFPARTRVFK